MTDAWTAWRAHRDRARTDPTADVEQPTLCRFTDCDRDATDTVGTMALCALHRSFIDQMMDEGTGTEPTDGSEVGEDEAPIVLPLIRRATTSLTNGTAGRLEFRPSS